MNYSFHLKTGFFRTTSCRMSLDEPGINLVPTDTIGERKICITWDSIFEICFLENENSIELDITTSNGTYLGVVKDHEQARRLAHELKEDHNINIRYQ